MKCPRCNGMCMKDDKACLSCGAPLRWVKASAAGRETATGKPPMAQRVSMIFMCLGAAIMPAAMGHEATGMSESIDWGAANWAGVGGACGAVFGMLIGAVFFGKK